MSVLSRLTAASYRLCLQVCVTNKTLVSINQLLSSFSCFSFHSADLTSFFCLGGEELNCIPEAFTNDLLPPRGQTGNCTGVLCIPPLHQGRAKCCAGEEMLVVEVYCVICGTLISLIFLYLLLTTQFVGEIICQQRIKVCRSEHLGLWWEVGGREMWTHKELSQCLCGLITFNHSATMKQRGVQMSHEQLEWITKLWIICATHRWATFSNVF